MLPVILTSSFPPFASSHQPPSSGKVSGPVNRLSSNAERPNGDLKSSIPGSYSIDVGKGFRGFDISAEPNTAWKSISFALSPKSFIILAVLVIITVISVSICILKVYEYYSDKNNNYTEESLKEIEEEITQVDEEINKKEKEIEEIKESKKEEVELIELWQKRVKEIQDYIS